MSHQSKGEVLGNVPVNTASTPGEPTGVRAIVDTEYVTGPIHNRSLLPIWENLDEHDAVFRKEMATPDSTTLVSAGDTYADITGRIYTGESIADDLPSSLYRFFRVTDEKNAPIFVGGRAVAVTYVNDLSAGPTSVIGLPRVIVSGTTNVTFSQQTLTHTDVLIPFSYCQLGDTLTVSGGTPNDGVYVFEEILTALSARVRKISGVEDAFTANTYSATIVASTNGYFAHRIDATEPADARVHFSETITPGLTYKVWFYIGTRTNALARNIFPGDSPERVLHGAFGEQDVYDNNLNPFYGKDPQTDNTMSVTELEIERQTSASIGVFGGTEVRRAESGIDNQITEVHTSDKSNNTAADMCLSTIVEFASLATETLLPGVVHDTAVLVSALADVTQVLPGVIQSATRDFVADGAFVGMSIRLGTSTVNYIIVEVAPGAANNRLRVDPDPGAIAAVDFIIYATIFGAAYTALTPNGNVIGTVTPIYIAGIAGEFVSASDTLVDTSRDFVTEAITAGFLVYVVGKSFNATQVHTVVAVVDATTLRLDHTMIESETGVTYHLIDPTMHFGKSFMLDGFSGNRLSISMLNGGSTVWLRDSTVDVKLFNIVSTKDSNVIGTNRLHDRITAMSAGTHRNLVGAACEGMQLLGRGDETLVSNSLLSGDVTVKPTLSADGLSVYPIAGWLQVGAITAALPEDLGIQRDDIIVPLEGDEAGVEFTVTEVCGPLVSVTPAPTFTSYVDTYQMPFIVKRKGGIVMNMNGEVSATEVSLSRQKDRFTPYTVGLLQGQGTITISAFDIGLVSNATPWVYYGSFPIKSDDTVRWLEFRVKLINAVWDPNAAIVAAVYAQTLLNNLGYVTYAGASPYLALGASNIQTGSRVVSGLAGLAGAVLPGHYYSIDGIGAWQIAQVLSDSVLILAEDHGQAGPVTGAVTITNGYDIAGTYSSAPSAEWVFVWATGAPIVGESNDAESHYLYVGGPDTGDCILSARKRITTSRAK